MTKPAPRSTAIWCATASASGYAVVTALTVGDEIVATLLGIRDGARYVMIRISNAGEKWSNCSPGRLIIERTMAALHKDGVREFDFSVGNYAYKRRFGVRRLAAGRYQRCLELARIALCLARSRRAVRCETIRSSMQACDACSVSRCHAKRIDALWLEFHGRCKSVTHAGIVRTFSLCSREFMIACAPEAYAAPRVRDYW